MDPNELKGNPLKLNPELGGKLVKLVHDDMQRAKREAEERANAARKKKKSGKR